MASNPEGRTGLIFWLILVVALTLLAIARWPAPGWLSTDFKSLLPGDSSSPWHDRAADAASANFDAQLVVMVQGSDSPRVESFVEEVKERFLSRGFCR